MALIKCTDCGKEISDKSLYCLNCGCPVTKEESPKKLHQLCPNCRNPMSPDSIVCPNCGTRLISVNRNPITENISFQSEPNNTTENRKKGSVLRGLVIFIIIVAVFSSIIRSSSNKANENSLSSKKQTAIHQSKTASTKKEPKIYINPSEIYNANGVSIATSDIEQSSTETTINFLLTSTSDKDFSISAHSYAINGLMAGGNLYGSDIDLPAGKNAKLSITLENQWLKENGIEKIAQLDLLFWVYYDNFKEWDTGMIELKTNLYDEGLMYYPSGEDVYSDPNVTIWYTGNIGNDYSFIIKNNNSYDSDYTIDNCSVNDWAYKILNYTYDLYNEPIHANSYDVFTLSINSDFMEEYNISQIESIEFNVLLGNKSTEKIIIAQ